MTRLVREELVLARDLMSRPVYRLTVETLLPDAAAFLLRHGISGAPVVAKEGRPVGVFTLTDLGRAVQGRLAPRAPAPRTLEARESPPPGPLPPLEGLEKTTVGSLMTPGLFTVFADATLQEVVRSMASQKIHRVFVISEEGDLEGVITTMDVLRWVDRQRMPPSTKERIEHCA
jgi:CBS domain-containing protein